MIKRFIWRQVSCVSWRNSLWELERKDIWLILSYALPRIFSVIVKRRLLCLNWKHRTLQCWIPWLFINSISFWIVYACEVKHWHLTSMSYFVITRTKTNLQIVQADQTQVLFSSNLFSSNWKVHANEEVTKSIRRIINFQTLLDCYPPSHYYQRRTRKVAILLHEQKVV